MNKKIGLLGGTFDPIHYGHINLALELMEKVKLDEVWFIPAQINPHKMDFPPTAVDHRLKMVELAIQEIEHFKLCDIEAKRPPPSFMLDTLHILKEEQSNQLYPHHFYLIMGEDTISGFFHWHLPQEIVRLVPLLIGSRSGVWKGKNDKEDSAIYQAIEKGLIRTRLMDISSTELRQRLRQQLYCKHLIPINTLNYIQQNQLYLSN